MTGLANDKLFYILIKLIWLKVEQKICSLKDLHPKLHYLNQLDTSTKLLTFHNVKTFPSLDMQFDTIKVSSFYRDHGVLGISIANGNK